MLAPLLSPVPSINIELVTEQTPLKEPSSPFDNIAFNVENGPDSYRSRHLLPPPVHSPKEAAARPTQPARGLGLDHARFEALKLASKKMQAPLKQDLRKELAIRSHQSKQGESLRSPYRFARALVSSISRSPLLALESPATLSRWGAAGFTRRSLTVLAATSP